MMLSKHCFLNLQVEKEVTELMNKSLKYCNTDCTSARQPMYLYRAAVINHRLASLYHNSYRQEVGTIHCIPV